MVYTTKKTPHLSCDDKGRLSLWKKGEYRSTKLMSFIGHIN